jgi:hypothetical protein
VRRLPEIIVYRDLVSELCQAILELNVKVIEAAAADVPGHLIPKVTDLLGISGGDIGALQAHAEPCPAIVERTLNAASDTLEPLEELCMPRGSSLLSDQGRCLGRGSHSGLEVGYCRCSGHVASIQAKSRRPFVGPKLDGGGGHHLNCMLHMVKNVL